jgi:hypothetical protein
MMDATQIRTAATEHAQAVVANDIDRMMADLASELHPQLPKVASMLPMPLTGARVLSVEVFEDYAETATEYSTPTSTFTMKARWEYRRGQPQIVAVLPE